MVFIKSQHNNVVSIVILCGLAAVWAWSNFTLSQASERTDLRTKQPELTWLIVRHADRDGSNDVLTADGHERAKQLATLTKVLRVSAVYSTDLRRTRDTAQPTADALQLPIQTYQQPSTDWLNQVRNANPAGVVLVVAHSNTVGIIVSELTGAEPFEIAHDQFDLLYIVKEQGDAVTSVQLNYGSLKTAKPSEVP